MDEPVASPRPPSAELPPPVVLEPEPDPPAPDDADTLAAWVAEWTVTVLLLVFITTTLVQSFVIPTSSMEDTLLVGDHLLVDKLSYAPAGGFSKHLLPYTPIQRGDIIVFRYPTDIKQTFVKRVIGLPGDRLRIENKQVYLNGQPVREKYKFHKAPGFDAYRDTFPIPGYTSMARGQDMLDHHIANDEILVPDNCYFAMGDNRDHSLDSRFWGFVPREHVIGKPLVIYWSYQTTQDRLTGALLSFDHFTDLARNFFSKTRWNRTFRFIRGDKVE